MPLAIHAAGVFLIYSTRNQGRVCAVASSYRQTFDKLCRVIRTSTVDLLEFRSVESGETSVMICAVKPMSAGQLEYQPLATMHACPMGPILLPGPQEPAVRALAAGRDAGQ
jgi:hypothetical protein